MNKWLFAIVLGVIALYGSAAEAGAAEKPNVVLMLADNVVYGDLGAYGGGAIRGMPTPRMLTGDWMPPPVLPDIEPVK